MMVQLNEKLFVFIANGIKNRIFNGVLDDGVVDWKFICIIVNEKNNRIFNVPPDGADTTNI